MNATGESRLYDYLRTLRENLSDIPEREREEIVREINTHVRERVDEGTGIDQVLRRLGSAEELAAEYRRETVIRKAAQSVSPLMILRASLLLAKRGFQGLCLFFIALFGYSLGGGLVVTAMIKPFFPKQTGLWIGPGVFDFGIHEPARYADPVHEVLGWGYIPIALVLGLFFLWLTTLAIRKWLRRSRRFSLGMAT